MLSALWQSTPNSYASVYLVGNGGWVAFGANFLMCLFVSILGLPHCCTQIQLRLLTLTLASNISLGVILLIIVGSVKLLSPISYDHILV